VLRIGLDRATQYVYVVHMEQHSFSPEGHYYIASFTLSGGVVIHGNLEPYTLAEAQTELARRKERSPMVGWRIVKMEVVL
jgi:hypothetical protein